MSLDYHGKTPVTEDDKKLAAKHLKKTLKFREDEEELNQEKIDDHKKRLIKAVKEGDKRSANYNKSHIDNHQKDLDDVDAEQDKLHSSLSTLKTLRTHSRKTYNDVRNSTVKLMYRKAHPDGSS
jgi:hypothetical protein